MTTSNKRMNNSHDLGYEEISRWISLMTSSLKVPEYSQQWRHIRKGQISCHDNKLHPEITCRESIYKLKNAEAFNTADGPELLRYVWIFYLLRCYCLL